MSPSSIDEVFVKRTATLSLLIVMTFALFNAGCGRGKASTVTSTAPTTQTIAPVAGQPAINGGDAVTQTVDVEDGRSEDDGGVLTNPQTAKAPAGSKTPSKSTPPVQPKKHR